MDVGLNSFLSVPGMDNKGSLNWPRKSTLLDPDHWSLLRKPRFAVGVEVLWPNSGFEFLLGMSLV